MGQSNLSLKKNIENKTEFLAQKMTFLAKGLKELRHWSDIQAPKALHPFLSYALDWLTPQLLGTGFRLFAIDDLTIKARIPAQKSNLNSFSEMNPGLIVNASLELVNILLQRQTETLFFKVTDFKLTLSKKMKWNSEIELILKLTQNQIDDLFIDIQKNNIADLNAEIQIGSHQNTIDHCQLKLTLETFAAIEKPL